MSRPKLTKAMTPEQIKHMLLLFAEIRSLLYALKTTDGTKVMCTPEQMVEAFRVTFTDSLGCFLDGGVTVKLDDSEPEVMSIALEGDRNGPFDVLTFIKGQISMLDFLAEEIEHG